MRITLYFDDASKDDNDPTNRYKECFECFDSIDAVPEEMKTRTMLTNLWDNDSWLRFLNREMHNRLDSYGVTYSLHFMRCINEQGIDVSYLWGIDIPENIAMLFKLTWC